MRGEAEAVEVVVVADRRYGDRQLAVATQFLVDHVIDLVVHRTSERAGEKVAPDLPGSVSTPSE